MRRSTLAESADRMWKAMRWADLGPTPDSSPELVDEVLDSAFVDSVKTVSIPEDGEKPVLVEAAAPVSAGKRMKNGKEGKPVDEDIPEFMRNWKQK